MGKTLIFTDVDYSANAINPQEDIHATTSYDNTQLWGMVTEDTTNKYIGSSGNIASDDRLCYIMIDINHYSKIVISGYSGTTTGSFHTSANPSPSAFISAVTMQRDGNLSNYEVNVPNGAKYFALNLWKDKNNYSFTKTN